MQDISNWYIPKRIKVKSSRNHLNSGDAVSYLNHRGIYAGNAAWKKANTIHAAHYEEEREFENTLVTMLSITREFTGTFRRGDWCLASVLIQDSRGFAIKVCADSLRDILLNCEILNGSIITPCVYIWDKSPGRNCLSVIPVTLPEFETIKEKTEALRKGDTSKNLIVGNPYNIDGFSNTDYIFAGRHQKFDIVSTGGKLHQVSRGEHSYFIPVDSPYNGEEARKAWSDAKFQFSVHKPKLHGLLDTEQRYDKPTTLRTIESLFASSLDFNKITGFSTIPLSKEVLWDILFASGNARVRGSTLGIVIPFLESSESSTLYLKLSLFFPYDFTEKDWKATNIFGVSFYGGTRNHNLLLCEETGPNRDISWVSLNHEMDFKAKLSSRFRYIFPGVSAEEIVSLIYYVGRGINEKYKNSFLGILGRASNKKVVEGKIEENGIRRDFNNQDFIEGLKGIGASLLCANFENGRRVLLAHHYELDPFNGSANRFWALKNLEV